MVEQPIDNHTDAGTTACAMPSDLDSIVDRLLDLARADAGDEIDRAVNRRAQTTLARTIRDTIGIGEADKAA
ncbi:hypothetical protein [Aliihoeflea sp. PC F10.4]